MWVTDFEKRLISVNYLSAFVPSVNSICPQRNNENIM